MARILDNINVFDASFFIIIYRYLNKYFITINIE